MINTKSKGLLGNLGDNIERNLHYIYTINNNIDVKKAYIKPTRTHIQFHR